MEPSFKMPSNANLPSSAPGAMNLPPVSAEGPASLPPSEQVGRQPEQPVAQFEQPVTPAGNMPSIMPLPAPIADQPMPVAPPPTATDVSNTTKSDVPQLADDGDLIEKEWVTKAKEIVAQTKENPYQQSRVMSGLRADYLQKRYQKTVKLSE